METNSIYCGDCARVLSQFPENSVDLIYADPPFFSNKHYEIIWGDGYEIRAFEDRWKGGIENYTAWMEPKLRECHRVLKPTGSLYLHCDWHANAHLRLLTDKIFGESNFRNEIVWVRTTGHRDSHKFNQSHDSILFYTRGEKYTWNPQYIPYNQKYIDANFNNVEAGRHFMADNLLAAGIRHGNSGKPWHGIDPTKTGNHWQYTVQKLEELDKQRKIHWPKKAGGMPRLKRYLDEMDGKPLTAEWTDIPSISAHADERLGYPTQKPSLLLERIIKASSNPADIVLDPFCGCGTALAVAQNIKDRNNKPVPRRWIGIDVSPTACKVMAQRMRNLGVSVQDKDIIGLPRTLGDVKAMQPFEFQNWVLQRLGGRLSERPVHDFGIDGWLLDRPVQVKQSDGVGRNVVDNFETALRRVKKKEGIIVAFDFGKGAYEEAARAKLEEGLAITLMTVEDVLNAG